MTRRIRGVERRMPDATARDCDPGAAVRDWDPGAAVRGEDPGAAVRGDDPAAWARERDPGAGADSSLRTKALPQSGHFTSRPGGICPTSNIP
jgi:hypothetical protein